MNTKYQALNALKAFDKADHAWAVELQKVYGTKAGDARYDRTLNGATPELRELKIERDAAFNAWERSKAAHNASLDAYSLYQPIEPTL